MTESIQIPSKEDALLMAADGQAVSAPERVSDRNHSRFVKRRVTHYCVGKDVSAEYNA